VQEAGFANLCRRHPRPPRGRHSRDGAGFHMAHCCRGTGAASCELTFLCFKICVYIRFLATSVVVMISVAVIFVAVNIDEEYILLPDQKKKTFCFKKRLRLPDGRRHSSYKRRRIYSSSPGRIAHSSSR
jgi:hypothetical protein